MNFSEWKEWTCLSEDLDIAEEGNFVNAVLIYEIVRNNFFKEVHVNIMAFVSVHVHKHEHTS